MSGCSLQDIKRDALSEASLIFKGNAKSITFKDNVATISYGNQYQVKTYNQAFEMAKRKLADVENWASKKFGEKFKYGWGKVDDSLSDKIRVPLTFPSNLYQAYSIKKNETSGRDLAYYNGDEQLMQQEEGFYQLDTPIKQGVSELFNENPQFASEIYEALGFNKFQFEPLNKYSSLNEFSLSKKEEAVTFLQSLDGKRLFSPSEMLSRISNAETSKINKGLSDYLNTILERYKGVYAEESVNPYRLEFKENLKLSNDDTDIEFGTLGGYNQAGKKFFNLDKIETRDIITTILHEFSHDIEPFVRTKDGFISSKTKDLQTPLTEKQKELGNKLNELRRFTITYLAEDFKKNRVAKLEQDVIDYENGKILEPFGKPASKVYIENLKREIEKTKKVIENNEVEKYIEKSTNIFFYRSHYGLSNINEFVAEALTNEKFREVLNDIPYKNTTLLSYLFELFQKILNIKKDTVLSEALNLIHELATTKRKQLNETQITPQQKQQAQQLYSQYLEQNPNGSVEQFKNWVNRNNINKPLFSLSTNNIKLGVSELFDSNPELANQVYEALGFNTPNLPNNEELDTIVKKRQLLDSNNASTELYNVLRKLIPSDIKIKVSYGRSGSWNSRTKELVLGVTGEGQTKNHTLKTLNHELLHSLTDLYLTKYEIDNEIGINTLPENSFKITKNINLTNNQNKQIEDLITIYNHIVENVDFSNYEYLDKLKRFGKVDYFKQGVEKDLLGVHELISESFTNPELINILKNEQGIFNKKTTLFKEFLSKIFKLFNINNASLLEDIYSSVENLIENNKTSQITPQQKQQAIQLYSQYLESLNKPNTNPILQDNQQEQIKKFKELQERLNNKKFIEGAKNSYESSKELQQFGTQEQYNDYIARVSLGIIKNPSSGEYNYTSKVKDIVYHGTEELFEFFDFSKQGKRNKGQGMYFSIFKKAAENYGKKIIPVILNSKNIKEVNITRGQNYGDVSRVFKLNNYDTVYGYSDLNKNGEFSDIYNSEYVVFEPEQIHILSSKQDIEGFKKFVDNNNFNQLETKGQPNEEIDNVIKKWLNSVGIQYNAVDKIYDTNGNEINAVAKADILRKLIEVIENKRGIDTLPEEAGHMLVRMLGLEHPLVKTMMRNVSKYKIYQEVLDSTYGDIYSQDEAKLREEAVGKVIAQVLVAKLTNTPIELELRREESRVMAIWKNIVNKLRRLIGTKAKDELSEFISAANIIIEGTPIEVSEKFNKGEFTGEDIFYQLDEETTKGIVNKLKSLGVYYNVKEKAYFNKEGKRIKNRVTDLVKALEAKRYKKKTETEMTPEAKQAAAAGTVTHAYFKEVTLRLLTQIQDDPSKLNKTKLNFDEVQRAVIAELMQDPEMAARGVNFVKSFNETHFNEVVTDVRRRLERIYKTQEFINKETGTKGKVEILPEFTIYNPSKDLAGTIDLLVIYSNGKTSIYDYKGQKYRTRGSEVVEDFRAGKILSGDAQVSVYRDVLRNEFGIEDFLETRLVPFNFQFNKAGNISTIQVGNVADNREYLDEVPVVNELTGIKELDTQLEKMYRERNNLQTKIDNDYKNKALRLRMDNLNKSIQNLIIKKNASYVYEEVKQIILDFQKRLTRPEAYGVNHYYLNNLINYLSIYNDFFREAKKIEQSAITDVEEVTRIERKYNDIYVYIKDSIAKAQEYNKILLEKKYPNIDLDAPVKEISFLGSMFTRLSQFDRGQFRILHQIVSLQQKYVREETLRLGEELEKSRDALHTWAKNNGLSLQQAMDKLITHNGKSLVSRYNGTYGEEKAKAIKNKDYKWFEQNTQIKLGVIGYEYANKEDADKFEELRKKVFKDIEENNIGNPKRIEKLKTDWETSHDITVNKDAIFNKPYYVRAIQHDRFMSDIWKYMNQKGNEPLLNTYNLLIETNLKLGEITGKEIKEGFIPEIQKGIVESLSNWNMGLEGIRDNIRTSFKVREENILLGKRDSNTGEVIPSIPLLFTDDITISLSTAELEELKKDLISKGLLEGSEDFITALNQLVYTKEREKGLLLKSRDLFASALLFAESAYTHAYSQNVEEEVKALRGTLENVETELSAPNGKKLMDKITGKVAKVVGAPKDEIEALDKFIKLHIYGQSKQTKDIVTEGGLSVTKTISQAMRGTSLKALGGSWLVAAGNLVGVSTNLIMAASEGKYCTAPQIRKAFRLYIGKGSKERVNAFMEYFQPFTHNAVYEKSRDLSSSTTKKYLNEDLFYIMMKYPDKGADIINMLGILQNFGIDSQGRIRRISDTVKPLFDTATIKNGKIEGLSDTQYYAVRNLITTSSVRLKGNMFKDDQNLIGTNIYTAMVMQFKNWMPGLIESRFKELSYDERIDDLDVGRFRVLFGEFTAKGLMPKLSTFIKLGTEVVSLGMYKALSNNANKAVAELYFNKFLEQNSELRGKITLDQFIELRQQKLRGMAMELRILMLLSLLVQLVAATIPDDDDEVVQEWITKNAYRMTNRGLLEVMFFFDPSTIKQIAGQPLPILKFGVELQKFLVNTIDSGRDMVTGDNYKGVFLWEKDKNDQTPPLYYTSKILPTRAVLDIVDIFGDNEKWIKK